MSDYIDVHRAVLDEMFELASELPMIHQPDAVVRSQPLNPTQAVEFMGQHYAAPDLETIDGIRADTYRRTGNIAIESLAKQAGLVLVQEVGVALMQMPDLTSYTPEDFARLYNDTSQSVLNPIKYGHFICSFYEFTKHNVDDADEDITVVSCRTQDCGALVSAESVKLRLTDGLLLKELALRRFAMKLDNPVKIDKQVIGIRQTIRPERDDLTHRAAILLDEVGKRDDLSELVELYRTELSHAINLRPNTDDAMTPDQLADNFLDKYKDNAELHTKLSEIVEEQRRRARILAEEMENVEEMLERELPSADELNEYVLLLRDARS